MCLNLEWLEQINTHTSNMHIVVYIDRKQPTNNQKDCKDKK